MHVIWTIFIGFIVGLFARAIMPGRNPMGFIFTTLLGIAGAVFGGFLGQQLGLYAQDESAGFFMSLLGAIIILFVYDRVFRKQVEKDPRA